MRNTLTQWVYFFVPLILISTIFNSAYALEIYSYDPDVHDRFVPGTYGTASPAANPAFWKSSYDWSGVGWDTAMPSRSVALVSPKTFVCAQHYKIPEGQTLTFQNSSGQLKTYTVDRYSDPFIDNVNEYGSHPSDLAMGWLKEAVSDSDGISHYAVMDTDDPSSSFYDVNWWLSSASDSLKQSMMLYGWNGRVGNLKSMAYIGYYASAADYVQTCYYVSNFQYQDFYNRRGELVQGTPGTAGAEGGDSGSPTIGIYNGRMVVIGTHSAVDGSPPQNTWRTYDAFVPRYVNDMELAMAGSGYSLDLIDVYMVPEPATLFLMASGLIGTFVLKKKR